MSVGMSFDERSGLLFVAGGGTGAAYVFDGKTGEMVASYQLNQPAYVCHDVIVTRQAAYFTDSFQKQLYVLPLGPGAACPIRLTSRPFLWAMALPSPLGRSTPTVSRPARMVAP